jgi:hypothetical protein
MLIKLAAYITAFTSRPILHVKPKLDHNQKPAAYTFADEVEKYRHVVKEMDLGEAYRRTGNSFKGQLEQHFIILKDRQGKINSSKMKEQVHQASLKRRNTNFGKNEHKLILSQSI